MAGEPSRPILALNAGSSSLKFGLHLVGPGASRRLLSGKAEVTEGRGGGLEASDAEGRALGHDARPVRTLDEAFDRIAALLAAHDALPPPRAVGHRIVHGGAHCRRHVPIDADVLQQLRDAAKFAPLHVPPALALLDRAQRHFAGAPQVACLDTAFHADMPEVARTLPLPRALRAQGIERYGFHGLSCESIVCQLREEGRDAAFGRSRTLPQRLVIAHLGHGASVTAVSSGRSIDTSMGLTPSGGVLMGTRCGDIDPGVLVHLAREHGCDAARLATLVDREAGMLGISAISGDLRELHAAAASSADARLAIAMFSQSVRKQIAAMAAVLGGIDLLVFTGGIGENDASMRGSICAGLEWLGIAAADAPMQPARGPGCVVRTMATLEEEQIARHAWQLTA